MRNLRLSTRLFLSCFGISALLFCGIYFYIKGFTEHRGLAAAERSFETSLWRLENLLQARHETFSQLAAELALGQKTSLPQAEFDATGLQFALLDHGVSVQDGKQISEQWLRESGRYLTRSIDVGPDKKLLLLYPLAEIIQTSHDLLKSFLAAGLVLLLLSGVLAHLFAREISRPLIGLRDRMRAMAEYIGFDAPSVRGDEIREISAAYADFAEHVQTAFEHKQLALYELQDYKAELLRVNANLQRRLFQVKVLLSLWSERDKALDVKDFLSRFLEALLPGLPFEYGCVIIRPVAGLSSETIFARKVPALAPHGEDAQTEWTDILDPQIKEFLLQESTQSMQSQAVRMNSMLGCVRPGTPPLPITVLSFRLQQGDEPLGSVHFLTESSSPAVSAGLNEFLLSLSAQVSAQLQIQALSFSTRLDPLTRLYNRGYLTDRLREELVRSSRKAEAFSLAFLEIDEFARLERSYGKTAADDTLRSLADLLKANCRGSDAVCRVAGATLAIVLADTPLTGATTFAENIRRAVKAHSFPIPETLSVTLGLAEFPGSGSGVEALLAQAEHALRAQHKEAA